MEQVIEMKVGQRLVHASQPWGVGIVRYVEAGKAIIRWPTHGIDTSVPATDLRPAPEFPRVYREEKHEHTTWVWLDKDTGVFWRWRGAVYQSTSSLEESRCGRPCDDGTWDHFETTGTRQADENIEMARAYFREKERQKANKKQRAEPKPKTAPATDVERLAPVLVDFANAVGGEHNRVGLVAAKAFAAGMIDAINTLPPPKRAPAPLPTPEALGEQAANHLLHNFVIDPESVSFTTHAFAHFIREDRERRGQK